MPQLTHRAALTPPEAENLERLWVEMATPFRRIPEAMTPEGEYLCWAPGTRAMNRAAWDVLARQTREYEQKINGISNYVGEVGKRLVLKLKPYKVLKFDSVYGEVFINLCRDEAGNVIVYKGGKKWEEGKLIQVKATIKEHKEREEIKQTIIQRPAEVA